MANQDLFKPVISLRQRYITIVAVALVCWMDSVSRALIAIAVFVAGAAFEGVLDACRSRGRK